MAFVRTGTPSGTMSWSQLGDNLDSFRGWVNDVQNADVSAGSIRREHLVRPVLGPHELASPFQQAAGAPFGLDAADALAPGGWGARVERFPLFPAAVPGWSGRWVLPIGRTFFVPTTRTVDVHCSFEIHVRSLVGEGSYPNGGGGPANAARAGYFSLISYNRDTGVELEDMAGQHAYGLDDASVSSTDEFVDKLVVSYHGTLTGAEYDLVLVYHRQSASTQVQQIDVGRVSWHLEGV